MSSVSADRHNLSEIQGFPSQKQSVLNAWAFEGKGLKGGVLWLVNFSNEVSDAFDSGNFGKVAKVGRETLNELATRTIPKEVIEESRKVVDLLKKTEDELVLKWEKMADGQLSIELWKQVVLGVGAYLRLEHNLGCLAIPNEWQLV